MMLSLVFLAACDSTQVIPVSVQWMDWPAEVASGQPFRTRLVVWGACALNPRFRSGASADQSAVSFAPYFITEENHVIACLQEREVESFLAVALDTAGTAPGLAADFPRTYEMRGATNVYAASASLTGAASPLRTFGEVLVRQAAPDASRRNAAGYVFFFVDTLGCARVVPIGTYGPGAALPLESQTDTAGVSNAFVRGYIYDAPAAVCGANRVFHLVAVD
ncbi:MAG: hypothetical protein ABR537_10835 [Gemmatimonadales bacterium]